MPAVTLLEALRPAASRLALAETSRMTLELTRG
jgi:hypothetical protein